MAVTLPAEAQESDPSSPSYGDFGAGEQVSSFAGSFGQAVPIVVPGFHGLEPKLTLSYSSEAGNGFAGVGWVLAGLGAVDRVSSGLGTPRFDSTDVFLLSGQELVPCGAGLVSPGCSSGGTHTGKSESYLKIRFDAAANTWTVWSRDGTRTTFAPMLQVASGTLRWGHSTVTDTSGNSTQTTWECQDGDCYPKAIDFGPYQVSFHREARPDALSFAARDTIATTLHRLRSIFVRQGPLPIRAYKLTYATSALTGRSLLTSVQAFGKDVVADSSGLITGGTSLPPTTFTYSADALGKSFQTWGGSAPTAPGTVEPVAWANLVNAQASGADLQKTSGGNAWNAGASSTRSIAFGDGAVEFTARTTDLGQMVGLSCPQDAASVEDIDYAIRVGADGFYAVDNGTTYGPWSFQDGDRLRVEVVGTLVHFKRNGQTAHASLQPPTYPLHADAKLFKEQTIVHDPVLSGALQDAVSPCDVLLTADFDGDGRTDLLCHDRDDNKTSRVSLATAAGFASPAVWLSGVELQFGYQTVAADLDGDGKADLVRRRTAGGEYSVARSTGGGFEAFASWGTAQAPDSGGTTRSCKQDPAAAGVGDFDGDGRTDVWCKRVTTPYVFVGLNTGSSFSFKVFGEAGCDPLGELHGSVDWNGDGKSDWYCIGSDNRNVDGYLSDGTRLATTSFTGLFGGVCPAGRYVFGDFNGDGRSDLACMNGPVALSTGKTLVLQGDSGAWCNTPTKEFFPADVDGDGRSELVCNDKDAGPDDVQVRKWTGSTFGPAETWRGSWCQGVVRGGDFNGDGKPDLHCSTLAAPVAIAGTDQVGADLVTEVRTTLGGTTRVVYTPSTQFPSANNPGPRHVVTALTVEDGRGSSSTTTYSYSGGLMDRQERRFLGFRYVKTTLPCAGGEAACPYVQSWLRQDVPSAGNPERIERRDGDGRLLSAQAFEYETATTVPRLSRLTGVWSYSYDETGTECGTWPCPTAKRTYTTHQYDGFGNRTLTVSHGDADPAGDEVTTAWAYQPDTNAYIVNRPTATQTFEGAGTGGTLLAETRYVYDGQGRLTASRAWLDTEGRFVERSTGYDGFGNVTSRTDETGQTTTLGYDPAYHLFPVTVTNAAGETTSTAWDTLCTGPVETTDANGQVTATQYDALCRPTRTDFPLGAFSARSYVGVGDPATQHVRVETPSASPEDGTGTHYALSFLDGLGRTYRTVAKGPSPGQTIVRDTAYDARGRTASTTAPYYSDDLSQATTYEYDSADRLTVTRLPDAVELARSYGLWSVTSFDAHGHPLTSSFDAHGRRIAKEELSGGQTLVTTYDYDPLGRLVGMADPLGNAWSWTFDSLGRTLQSDDPDAGTWTYQYDDAGRTRIQTDAKGQVTELTYDLAGRQQTRTVGGETTTYTYGESRAGYFNVGRLTTVQSPRDMLRTDYDALGRGVKTVRTFEGVDYAAERRYDAAGYLRGLTYPDGDAVGLPSDPLRYDAVGRLRSIPGFVSDVQYNAANRPMQQVNLNGTVTTRDYSAQRGFLVHIGTTGPGGTIQDMTYSPDDAGLVTEVASPFPNESWAYAYDDLHRLTAAQNTSDPGHNQTFAYDEIGRIINNSRVGAYVYPADGSTRPHAPSIVDGEPYNYDPNGNLVSGGGRSVQWTAYNLPSQVDATEFTYAGTGERLKKQTGTSVSLYPLGDDYEITNGTVTKYVSAGSLGVVAKRVGSTSYWLHTDRLGSIQAITDAAGAQVHRRTYRPYGETLEETGSHEESRGYIDQRQDEETGLTYLHARYFEARLGIFLSPDPIGADPNTYGYGYGNPVNSSDRSGLRTDEDRVPTFPIHVRACPGLGPLLCEPWWWWASWDSSNNNSFPAPNERRWGHEQRRDDRRDRAEKRKEEEEEDPNNGEDPNQGGDQLVDQLTEESEDTTDGDDTTDDRAEEDVSDSGEGKKPTQPDGYTDLNISGGQYGVGGTFGYYWGDGDLTCGYLGGGFMTPGMSGSLTRSSNSIGRGWNVGLQVNVYFVFQVGWSRGGGWFTERGGGLPPSVSLTGYYVGCGGR